MQTHSRLLAIPNISPLSSQSSASTSNRVALPPGLTHVTPLLDSAPLSALLGTKVWLKLDALQPSGSFKDRGMAHMCSTLQQRGIKRIISSSGGNAGLAASTAGRKLGLQVQVVVPETTKPLMIKKMCAVGAHVDVQGANWNEADALARSLVQESGGAAYYVPPFEDPLLWEGHSSIVDEIVDTGVKPGAIVLSVGGGGLLNGIYTGLQRHGWSDVPVVTAETEGASCFASAVALGRSVRLSAITSIATSLGALEVSPTSLQLAK